MSIDLKQYELPVDEKPEWGGWVCSLCDVEIPPPSVQRRETGCPECKAKNPLREYKLIYPDGHVEWRGEKPRETGSHVWELGDGSRVVSTGEYTFHFTAAEIAERERKDMEWDEKLRRLQRELPEREKRFRIKLARRKGHAN